MEGDKTGKNDTELKRRLVHMDTVWWFILAVTLLATASIFELAESDINRELLGFLSGAWFCVMAGFAFWVWRRGELRG